MRGADAGRWHLLAGSPRLFHLNWNTGEVVVHTATRKDGATWIRNLPDRKENNA
jgi:hypothetical protein